MTQQTDQIPTPEEGSSTQSLRQQITAWVRPPVFPEDEVKTRRAAILNTILIGMIGLGLLYGLTLPWSRENLIPALLFGVLLIVIIAVGLVNIRRGNVVPVAYLVVLVGWLFAAIFSAIFGGVISPIFASFAAVIFAAGLLLDFRGALIAGTTAIMYGVLLYFLELRGTLPAVEYSPLDYLTRFAFVFLVVGFLIFLTNRNFLQALNSADKARRDAEEAVRQISVSDSQLHSEIETARQVLHRNKNYIDAAKSIALSTTTSTDFDVMLDYLVDTIASQFGYYHVGLFLIDDNKEWAVLRSASSEGGREMVARGHQLGVGRQGIVGFVTSIGQPRITQDTELDRIHSVTPELPKTRAEMALPLEAHDEIIGALDIQDRVPNAFSDEDISALQLMADQISIAIENFRLIQEAEGRHDETQRVYDRYGQRAWAETHRQKSFTALRYSEGNLIPISDPMISLNAANKLEIPIQVRGEKIGIIEIAKENPQDEWSREEKELLQTLSDQLGIALDSARLFNETQLRASTEQIIGDINADIWESLEINSILRTAVQKLQRSLELPEVSIKMTPPSVSQQQPGSSGSFTLDESN